MRRFCFTFAILSHMSQIIARSSLSMKPFLYICCVMLILLNPSKINKILYFFFRLISYGHSLNTAAARKLKWTFPTLQSFSHQGITFFFFFFFLIFVYLFPILFYCGSCGSLLRMKQSDASKELADSKCSQLFLQYLVSTLLAARFFNPQCIPCRCHEA